MAEQKQKTKTVKAATGDLGFEVVLGLGGGLGPDRGLRFGSGRCLRPERKNKGQADYG